MTTVGIEAGQLHPLRSRVRRCRDSQLQLLLGRCIILALFGDLGPQFVAADGVKPVQLRRHCRSLVHAAAHEARRGIVKLAQIRQRRSVAWIQPDGLLKLDAHALAQRIGAHKRSPAGLLAQSPAQPQMIVRIFPVQLDRLFAVPDGSIPIFQRQLHAALEVVSLRRTARLGQRAQQRQSLIRFAGLQVRVGLSKLPARAVLRKDRNRRRGHSGQRRQSQPRQNKPGYRPHCTTWIGMPSCKGFPLTVPVATTSPCLSPERIATWVRLIVPVVTKVFCSLSFTTL